MYNRTTQHITITDVVDGGKEISKGYKINLKKVNRQVNYIREYLSNIKINNKQKNTTTQHRIQSTYRPTMSEVAINIPNIKIILLIDLAVQIKIFRL